MRLSQSALTRIKIRVARPDRFGCVARIANVESSPWVKDTIIGSNVGGIDRIVLGLVLIGLTLNGNAGIRGWLGIVPLATGSFGCCPPYAIFSFSTCAMKKKT